jgi:hypothetical protein
VADAPDPGALARELASLTTGDVVSAMSSTLAALAAARLEHGDLAEARRAIDTLAALLPLVEGPLRGDLERVVAGLQIAYVDAGSEPARSDAPDAGL